MITHDEKAYLNDRINQVMELLFEIVQEMGKWKTEIPQDLAELIHYLDEHKQNKL